VLGQFFRLAGVAFIDRGDTGKAKSALAPAVAKLRDEAISLVIAPEGTRSATPRLGGFKKGAFHIAMQAEVPVVPIVIHNAGEVMWRGSQTLHGGTVNVTVLPPIDTSGWSAATIGAHVAEVREMYLDALAEPGPEDGRATPAREHRPATPDREIEPAPSAASTPAPTAASTPGAPTADDARAADASASSDGATGAPAASPVAEEPVSADGVGT
jgi:1-acyl-sn-glycerol-3-phosphate acyltransferase